MNPGDPVLIIKNDYAGREVWRYDGVVMERGPEHVTLEARFNRDDMDLGWAVFRRGDRFVEHFYSDRWYNVFEVHDADDDRLKGWYCNFTRPARITKGQVAADDLALDLWVTPDGRKQVLDQAEFEALALSPEERQQVLAALDKLQRKF